MWTIFSNSGPVAHRMIIEHVLEHLTSVSGDLDHAPISPSTMISEMINALPDERVTGGPASGTGLPRAPTWCGYLTFFDRTMYQPL